MMSTIKSSHANYFAQRGATLIVAMILLLLITMIGVAGMQTTNMQERMAGAMMDRNQAFQTAESALRRAEIYLAATKSPTSTKLGSTAKPGSSDYWDSTFNWTSKATAVTDTKYDELAADPLYVIEKISTVAAGSSVQYKDAQSTNVITYRVTAKGTGLSSNTQVILQSTYRPK
jgi:type IV pilus assembly protein PilX